MIKMKNNLKRVMTDLAAGHITQLEADEIINAKTTQPEEPLQRKKVSENKDQYKINKKGGKTKSHRNI